MIVVRLLKNEKLLKGDLKNHWFRHACGIATQIKRDFSNITSAKHLGNDYTSIGDVAFISNGREINIEVKMSDTKSGWGTKANIGQDALTDNKLFGEGVDSWSEYRTKKRHDLWIMKYLDEFKKYPAKILGIGNLQKNKEMKARYLRMMKRRDKVAARILGDIQKQDRAEKEEYLLYLSKQKQVPENIRRFLSLIVLGIHKKEEMTALIESDKFIDKAQKLILYYGNLSGGRIIVSRQDVGSALKKILSGFKYFEINFSSDITHCKLVGVNSEGNKMPLLQIVLHWKNIAQGIKTPCLNIFDLYSNAA